jgi:hypothetical protein
MRDQVVEGKIEQEVSADLRLWNARVRVDVIEGFVVLGGVTGFYIQKMIFDQIARETTGVVAVENEIRVLPVRPVTGGAIKRRTLEVLPVQYIRAGVLASIAVQSGAVVIHAPFGAFEDIQNLRRRIAGIQGVIEIHTLAEFLS